MIGLYRIIEIYMEYKEFNRNGLKCLFPAKFVKLETKKNLIWAYNKHTLDSILISINSEPCLKEAFENQIMQKYNISDSEREGKYIRQGKCNGKFDGIECVSQLLFHHNNSVSSYWQLLLTINEQTVSIDIASEGKFEDNEKDLLKVINSIEIDNFKPFETSFTKGMDKIYHILSGIILFPFYILNKRKMRDL